MTSLTGGEIKIIVITLALVVQIVAKALKKRDAPPAATGTPPRRFPPLADAVEERDRAMHGNPDLDDPDVEPGAPVWPPARPAPPRAFLNPTPAPPPLVAYLPPTAPPRARPTHRTTATLPRQLPTSHRSAAKPPRLPVALPTSHHALRAPERLRLPLAVAAAPPPHARTAGRTRLRQAIVWSFILGPPRCGDG